MRATSQLRPALRAATAFPIDAATIDACVGAEHGVHDAAFRRARIVGLRGLAPGERSGGLWPVVGEVAESVAAVVLDELGFDLFWQLAKRGARGVDLLLLSPDGCVLALEVKGTLRAGTIPRLTRSRLRQMSRVTMRTRMLIAVLAAAALAGVLSPASGSAPAARFGLELDGVAAGWFQSATFCDGSVTLARGTGTPALGSWALARKRSDPEVVLYDGTGKPVARYHLEQAWPAKIEIGSLAAGGEVAIESLVLAYEGRA